MEISPLGKWQRQWRSHQHRTRFGGTIMQCNCGGILRAWYFCAAGYHYRTCEGCGKTEFDDEVLELFTKKRIA
jgi:hypothetical protein